MASWNPFDEPPPEPEPCDVIEVCPICGGQMETVYNRHQQRVCVCKECQSGVTIPASAWHVARMKRAKQTA